MAIAFQCICGSNVLESHKGICPKCGAGEIDSTSAPVAVNNALNLLVRQKKPHLEYYVRDYLGFLWCSNGLTRTFNEDRKQLVDDYNQLVDEHNKLIELLKKPAYK